MRGDCSKYSSRCTGHPECRKRFTLGFCSVLRVRRMLSWRRCPGEPQTLESLPPLLRVVMTPWPSSSCLLTHCCGPCCFVSIQAGWPARHSLNSCKLAAPPSGQRLIEARKHGDCDWSFLNSSVTWGLSEPPWGYQTTTQVVLKSCDTESLVSIKTI